MNTPIIIEQGSVRIIDRERAVIIGYTGPQGATQDLSGLLVKASNLSDLTDAAAARTNLGLGTAAAKNVEQIYQTLEQDTTVQSGGRYIYFRDSVAILPSPLTGVFIVNSSLIDLTLDCDNGENDLTISSGEYALFDVIEGISEGGYQFSVIEQGRYLGTAATRDVGQASGNVPELSAAGRITLGQSGVNGSLAIRDDGANGNALILSINGTLLLDTPGNLVGFTNVADYTANFSLLSLSDSRTYTLPDASGTLALTAEVKSANFTAANDGEYTVVATCTVTDPSPVEGKGYTVFVRNGTVTMGVDSFGTAGTTIRRVYHSGAWANYSGSGSVAVGDITGLGTGVATALAVNVGSSGAFVTNTGTDTLTNKRVTRRVTSITSSATPTVNTDNCDCVTITALATAITSMTTNLSGTPSNFDQLLYRIKDNGTARAITWGASFAARGGILPTTTVASKVWHVLFIYNSVAATWDCVSSSLEV